MPNNRALKHRTTVKKSVKIGIAAALAILMLAVFGLELFAADKIIDAVMPAVGVSVTAFCSNVEGASEVANLSNIKFSIANANSGNMSGKAQVPVIYVRNHATSQSDKDFMVYSLDGTLPNPKQISAIFLDSARFETVAELKTWLLRIMGNANIATTAETLVPEYTDNTVTPAVHHPAKTWATLVEEHGALTSMAFIQQGQLDPSDSESVLTMSDEEVIEAFNLYEPVSFVAESCTFADNTSLTADETETEKAKAEAILAGTEPPVAATDGTWIITISKALDLRNSSYVTVNYGSAEKYDKVAWVLNHSYPTLDMHDMFADAGTSYSDLVNRIMASYSASEEKAQELVRIFTYAIIQYAIWYHTGYAEESATPGVSAVLGNKMNEGVAELKVLYEHLTADRDYAGYATKVMNNNMMLKGFTGTEMEVNSAVTAAKDDDWFYYGPFSLNSDLFSAGNIEATLEGFETEDPATGALITNTPAFAFEDKTTRTATINVRQGEEFFIAIHKDYAKDAVEGLHIKAIYPDATGEGAQKSRMFQHVPGDVSDIALTPLAVGATTVGVNGSDDNIPVPVLIGETGRRVTFSASGVDEAPLPGVKIIIKEGDNEVASGITNDQGEYTPAEALRYDTTYTYYETSVPDGYALNTTHFRFTVGADNEPETIPNRLTEVKIRKVRASDHSIPMPGATIAIYSADDPTSVITYLDNDSDGYFEKIGLPWGEYQYREQIPSGNNSYEPVGSIYEFKIAQDGTPSGTLEFYGDDDVVPGQATIRVVDDAGNPIPGSTVIVYAAGEEDDPIATLTSNAQGYVNTGELEPGEYRYKQTAVPDGYELNNTVHTFEVEDDGDIQPAPADIVCNRVKKTVTIKAYNTVTNGPVSNVVISVFPVGKPNDITSITTGTDGTKSVELPYGEYAFMQKETVSGYSTNKNKYYFTVGASITGDSRLPLTPSSANGGGPVLPPSTDGSFSVIAGDTQTGLPGVVIRVYNSTGAVVYEGTTDAAGKITLPSTLAAGTYTYKMISAPSGYAVNPNTFTFTKDANGTYSGLQNITASVVTVIIKKVAATDTSKTLSGATLTLYSSAGTALDTKVTGADGLATFTKLAYGSYYIKETAAPSGYTLASDIISFSVDATYVNKEATVLKNSAAVQTGGEMAALYGIICAVAIAGIVYTSYRKRRID